MMTELLDKKIIYISSPYTIGNQADNVRRQVMVANELLTLGFVPFCPCLSHLWHLITPKPQQEWLDIDLALLSRMDALLRLPGESEGADNEVAFALQSGLPVYYSLEEIEIGEIEIVG